MLILFTALFFGFALYGLVTLIKRIVGGIGSLFKGKSIGGIEFSVDAGKIYIHANIEGEKIILKKFLQLHTIDNLVKQLKAEKKRMLS